MKSRNVAFLLAVACLLLVADSALAARCCQTATGCFDTENEELCKSCGGSLNFTGFCGEDGMCQDTAPNPASTADAEELTCSAEISPMATEIDITKLICKLIETPKSRQVASLGDDSGTEDRISPPLQLMAGADTSAHDADSELNK